MLVNMEIVLATHNKHKIAEISEKLGKTVLSATDVGVDEIEENGSTFEENAAIKAKAVWIPGRLAIADDSGLCVNALNGVPGIYSARYAGEPTNDQKNNEKLLSALEGIEDRSAYYVCVIVCILPSGKKIVIRGETHGVMLKEYRGNGGFGYDPLFLCNDTGKTFAEMTMTEKNAVSHRGKAVEAMIARLNEDPEIQKELCW